MHKSMNILRDAILKFNSCVDENIALFFSRKHLLRIKISNTPMYFNNARIHTLHWFSGKPPIH